MNDEAKESWSPLTRTLSQGPDLRKAVLIGANKGKYRGYEIGTGVDWLYD
jgi:hypothetical protein